MEAISDTNNSNKIHKNVLLVCKDVGTLSRTRWHLKPKTALFCDKRSDNIRNLGQKCVCLCASIAH